MVTLVLGASENPERYSYKAVERLQKEGYKVIAIGRKSGQIHGTPIQTEFPLNLEIHTLSLYLSPKNQGEWEDAILSLKPQRVLFNPGTENPAFAQRLRRAKIQAIEVCTLVLLATNQYES